MNLTVITTCLTVYLSVKLFILQATKRLNFFLSESSMANERARGGHPLFALQFLI